MSKKGFLITIEGLEHSGMQRLGERLSGKLRHKGYNSVFGMEPAVSPFGNYFREAIQKNLSVLVASAVNSLNLTNQFNSMGSAELSNRMWTIYKDFIVGKEISAIDLYALSLFERKFHLRAVVKEMMERGGIVILKGYELGSLAAGLSAGISFDELSIFQKEVLGDDYIRPDVTVLVDVSPKAHQSYLWRNGPAGPTLEESESLALNYERAVSSLQRSFNYGFVSRLNGEKTEGLVFANMLGKLARFIPALA